MNARDELIRRVKRMLQTLAAPLPDSELKCGWDDESREAMKSFFERLLGDLEAGRDVSALPEYQSITRGMDHWGITGGRLLEEAAHISARIRAS